MGVGGGRKEAIFLISMYIQSGTQQAQACQETE